MTLLSAPRSVPLLDDERRTDGPAARALQVLVLLTVATASFEGYLLDVSTVLTKLPAAALVLTWGCVRLAGRRMPSFLPLHLPVAVLAVAVLASTAVHNGDTYAMEYAQRWLPFLLALVALADTLHREVPVRVVVAASVLGAAVAAGGALWSFLIDGEPRATGPMEDPNDLAYVLVAAVPLLLAMIPPRRRADGRERVSRAAAVLVGALLVLLAVGAAVTVSRGGLIALGIAVGWLAVRRAFSARVLVAGAVAVVVGALGVTAGFSEAVSTALFQKTQVAGSNIDARALRWEVALSMLPEQPLLGVGPGGFRSNYLDVSHNAELAEQTPVAHNMYVEVAAELGLIGAVGFLGMIGAALWASERAVRAARTGPDRRLALGVQGSLLAVCVASTFLSEQYYMPLYAMVAAACALAARAEHGGSG